MNGENEPTEVQDFGAVLGTPLNGERPLLVGGHAMNLWAWAYRDRIGDGHIGSRDAIDQLELARTTVRSAHAIKCKTEHAIDFSEVWPRQLLLESTDERIQNFVKHRLPPSE